MELWKVKTRERHFWVVDLILWLLEWRRKQMSPSRIQTRCKTVASSVWKNWYCTYTFVPSRNENRGLHFMTDVVPLKKNRKLTRHLEENSQEIRSRTQNTLYFGQNLNRGISTISCSCCLDKKFTPRRKGFQNVRIGVSKRLLWCSFEQEGYSSLKVNSFIEKERTFARRIVP